MTGELFCGGSCATCPSGATAVTCGAAECVATACEFGLFVHQGDCAMWVTRPVGEPTTGASSDQGAIRVTGDDVLHAGFIGQNQIRYGVSRDHAQTWSFESIAPVADRQVNLDFEIGSDGTVYLLHSSVGGPITLETRSPLGAWTSEQIDPGHNALRNSSEDYYTDSTHAAALALDSGNAPHVVYVDTDTIRYLHRTTAGWQRETVLAEVSSSIDVAFGPDGNLNFVANDRRSSVFAYVIFVRDSAGTWSEQEIYSYRDTGSGADVVSMDRLVFGPDGRPYVQARAGGGISAGSGTCTGNRLVLYSRSGSAWSSTLVDVGLHGGASNIGQTVFMAGDLYVPHYNDSVDFPYPGYGVPQIVYSRMRGSSVLEEQVGYFTSVAPPCQWTRNLDAVVDSNEVPYLLTTSRTAPGLAGGVFPAPRITTIQIYEP